jgi:hypothetical protein
MCHDGPGAGGGAVPDLHRRHQQTVASDEDRPAYHRAILLTVAAEVAGDRACADVRFGADLGIADIGEMTHLDPGAKMAVLDLAEVAHVHAPPEMSPRAQMRERADVDFVVEAGALHHG